MLKAISVNLITESPLLDVVLLRSSLRLTADVIKDIASDISYLKASTWFKGARTSTISMPRTK